MKILITRDLILKEIEKQCDLLRFSPERKQLIIEHFDTNSIFEYFKKIDQTTIKQLFKEIADVGSSNLHDPKNAETLFRLLVTKNVLGLLIESLLKQKNEMRNLTDDEKINLLIDYKTSIELEGVDKITSDTLEDEIIGK